MSVTQTVLVFAGIPLAVILLVFALVYATSSRRGSKRYRPGRPFSFSPVWFLAAPQRAAGQAQGTSALPSAEQRTALAAGPLMTQTQGALPVATATHGETGGASDSW